MHYNAKDLLQELACGFTVLPAGTHNWDCRHFLLLLGGSAVFYTHANSPCDFPTSSSSSQYMECQLQDVRKDLASFFIRDILGFTLVGNAR